MHSGVLAGIISAVFLFIPLELHAEPKAEEICKAARACMETGALCVFAQIPRNSQKKIVESEAYGDFVDRFTTLSKTKPNVHFMTANEDLASFLKGLKKLNRLRVIFLSKGGRALESEYLYSDDPGPVVAFFESKEQQVSPVTGSNQGVLRLSLSQTCR